MDGAEENKMDMQPKGRAAYLAVFKSRNPEMTEEPEDDAMWDHAGRGWQERDEMEGRYNELNGLNTKLAENIAGDPRFAQFVAMVANGEPLMYSLGKSFGPLIDQISDEHLEELQKGQADYAAGYDKIKGNFSQYRTDLQKYCEENGLDEEMQNKIDDAIMDLADAFNDRAIGTDIIDIVYKGLDSENLQQAANVAGRNEAIDESKGKGGESPVPDLGGKKTNPSGYVKPYEPKLKTAAQSFVDKPD